MEQEMSYNPFSPRKVRKQLTFSTPSKSFKVYDARSDSIQQSPKGKMSKSKVVEKVVGKNKFVIDFNLESNYFLDEIDTNDYFKTEQKEMMMYQQSAYKSQLCSTDASWLQATPYKTAKKSEFASACFSDFTSVMKEPRNKTFVEESPFCKLLNESDQFSSDKYQTIPEDNEFGGGDEGDLQQQFFNQILVLENFFDLFQQRSVDVTSVFTQDSIFEIIGESNIHPLIVTLNAIAKVFTKFEHESDKVCFDYKFASSDDDSEIIITTTGRLVSENYCPNFVLSAKVLINECLIRHVKLQFC